MAGHRGLEVLIGIAVFLLLTWLLLAALVVRGPKGRTLQLEAAYRQFSPSGVAPGRNRRLRPALLVLAVLVILNMVWLGFLLSRGPGEQAVKSTPAQTGTPGGLPSSPDPSPPSGPRKGSEQEERTIQVEDSAASARPFQTVRIQGTYRGGADTFLRVQRWEGGKWVAFPLPTKTDKSGQFTAYVELGQPGRYQLRVLDPDSGVTSKTFVLVIKG
jgi:hypothetical protein